MVGFVCASKLAGLLGRTWRRALVVAVSLAFLVALHGVYSVHVVLLAAGGYALARAAAGVPYGLLAVWAYAVATLLAARLTEGLPLAALSPSLAALGAHRGLLRWHIHYNLLVLRVISYAADLHAAARAKRSASQQAQHAGQEPQEPRQQGQQGQQQQPGTAAGGAEGGRKGGDALREELGAGPGGGGGGPRVGPGEGGGAGARQLWGGALLEQLERERVSAPLPLPCYYGMLPYLEYCLYPPLYIGGPIITYNSFASQRTSPIRTTAAQVAVYLLRLALVWGCLELLTHLLPYNGLVQRRGLEALAASAALPGSGAPAPRPLHFAIAGYWVLVFMWLKFTVIWRFFRSAALLDGVVAPENMTRCVCDNYDIEGFWRSWHASYNRWLVRYMYVPLGGAAWRGANVWLIFSWVALWHDLEWRLLGWAWIMAAAMAPELAVKALARTPAARRWHGTAAFRHACALAAAANILLLMAGNLVGFVVGVDGIGPLVQQVLGEPHFLPVVLLALFCAAHLMFWKREAEAEGRAREAPGAGAEARGRAGGGR